MGTDAAPPTIKIIADSTTSYALSISGNKITANPDLISGSCQVVYDSKVVGTITGIATAENTILHCGDNAKLSITSNPSTITANDMALTWTPPPTPSEPPAEKIEFLDSLNPFAKALDAWQTGKASWTKSILYRREPTEEEQEKE